jgi:hypothetical protein
MKSVAQYVALMNPVVSRAGVPFTEQQRLRVSVYCVGKQYTKSNDLYALHDIKRKTQNKVRKAKGSGDAFNMEMQYITFDRLRDVVRWYPHLRKELAKYDPEYVEYRNRVEHNKKVRDSKKRVGIRFGSR